MTGYTMDSLPPTRGLYQAVGDAYKWLHHSDAGPVVALAGVLVTFLGVSFTLLGVFIAARNIKEGVNRGRRELTANLFYNWSRDVDWAASRAIELAEQLPQQIVNAIIRKDKTSIPAAWHAGVTVVLREKFPQGELPKKPHSAGAFEVTKEHSAFIHFLWFRWLNRLEGTLAAWIENAANPNRLENEFGPLVIGYQKVLDRLVVPGDLPILTEFQNKIAAAWKRVMRDMLLDIGRGRLAWKELAGYTEETLKERYRASRSTVIKAREEVLVVLVLLPFLLPSGVSSRRHGER